MFDDPTAFEANCVFPTAPDWMFDDPTAFEANCEFPTAPEAIAVDVTEFAASALEVTAPLAIAEDVTAPLASALEVTAPAEMCCDSTELFARMELVTAPVASCAVLTVPGLMAWPGTAPTITNYHLMSATIINGNQTIIIGHLGESVGSLKDVVWFGVVIPPNISIIGVTVLNGDTLALVHDVAAVPRHVSGRWRVIRKHVTIKDVGGQVQSIRRYVVRLQPFIRQSFDAILDVVQNKLKFGIQSRGNDFCNLIHDLVPFL